jgi:hypothetical protein
MPGRALADQDRQLGEAAEMAAANYLAPAVD